MDDRLMLQGILFVLFTGIGWEDLPQELGFGSGMTCWRRVRDWQAAGVFDFDRVIADASHVRAKKGGAATGPRSVDRRKAVRARGHFPSEQAALKCLYLVTRSLDPTDRGKARWAMRWNPALNAFAITFEGRITLTGN